MASHSVNDLVATYLQTATAALIAVGAATALNIDFGKALLASAIAATLPVLSHFVYSKGE